MNLPETLLNFLRKRLGEKGESLNASLTATALSGGSINSVYKLSAGHKNFALKLNQKERYPGMFEAEAQGLKLLGRSKALPVPCVIDVGEFEEQTFLLLDFVEPGNTGVSFWEKFAQGLSALHQTSAESFGLDHHNYIGSLPQQNNWEKSWAEFFALHRLEPQLKMAYDGGFFGGSGRNKFQKLMQQLPALVPAEKPALLHGDLWSGNYLVNANGQPVLIDPAVYYGHRETDLAMMHLFGGFDPSVFDCYHTNFPLETGWRGRVDLHNLYPLLVHVNLFGGGYASRVSEIIRRFS